MLADNILVVITFLSKGDTSPQGSSEEAVGERETLSISCRNQGEADGEGEERVAVRRAREEVESVPPPQKGTLGMRVILGLLSLRQQPRSAPSLSLLTNPYSHTHSSSRDTPPRIFLLTHPLCPQVFEL